MVIFLYGPDSYRRGARLATLRDAFQKKFDPQGLSISRIDGTQFSADDFQRMSASAGLFAQKRFVVLADVFAIAAEDQEILTSLLPTISDDTILVVTADALPQKKSELKTQLLASTTVEEFKKLNVPEAEALITQEVAHAGATIEPIAAHTLAQRLHENTWQAAFVAKSLGYRVLSQPQKLVTRALVEEALGEANEENFFSLTDAVGAKNLAAALQLLQKHVQEGAVPQMLISVLGKHIGLLRLAHVAPTEDFAGVHPYVLKKAREQAKRFTAAQLGAAHDALLQLDSDSKTGNAPDVASNIVLILTELCAPDTVA